ncbi:MAG: hypothetical protein R3E89_09840 [Thiolinea sp.]
MPNVAPAAVLPQPSLFSQTLAPNAGTGNAVNYQQPATQGFGAQIARGLFSSFGLQAGQQAGNCHNTNDTDNHADNNTDTLEEHLTSLTGHILTQINRQQQGVAAMGVIRAVTIPGRTSVPQAPAAVRQVVSIAT